MLTLDHDAYLQMVAHAFDGLPNEACGLLGGRLGAPQAEAVTTVETFVSCRNVDESSRTYSIGPEGFLAADRALGPGGLDIVGVMHSHTHTSAYPSPTDVAKADNPLLAGWHYVIVSLRHETPVVRSYLIDGGTITEEPVELASG